MLNKISKKKFNLLLKNKKNEDLDFLKFSEDFLIKKRGFIFKQPKKGDKVILLLSGGIDSVVAWAVLMKVYGYQVYPVIIDRGSNKRAKRELSAVRYFEKYFSKKYPEQYIRPFHLSVNTVAKEIIDTLDKNNITPEDIVLNYKENKFLAEDNSNVVIARAKGVSPYLMPFYGVVYSDYLKFIKGLDIHTILVGVNFSDGIVVSSQTFTALRSTLLSMCVATDNYKWNFSSVFLERETGVYMDKLEIIKLGNKLGIPLKRTWSCYNDGIMQCGDSCATCIDRKRSFYLAGIKDETYYRPYLFRLIKDKVKSWVFFFK
ncbi:hypothetical protein COV58_02870 [Candidatus Roizmanbacteria bacterium CG11_big_fil_rev_8_21_14_0_20_36_8]|uniref:7-cyano-7-deazaguanine synthase n=1 Tax=Candidatus Roizmanbacteria bacterium CG11_big_fil_rev_8_21_14_0_20_36_8 TaxID=1974856 RepID=A0A2M6IU29_9BACT|nr:MAG: hypothetical protein COV58_02870 [Candidatus Roizmanbacteria bacterium CG11_big_fil_rev_8_21_14_0_20_36_8]PIR63488.1 MAG: hypothetical protein COU64_04285 [Candidatus Pacebacteria bacterium CG10_big_fil_rev_8_21_14_0_10_40_26]